MNDRDEPGPLSPPPSRAGDDPTDPAPDRRGEARSITSAGTVTWSQLAAETQRRLAPVAGAGAAGEARRLVEEASGLEGAERVLGWDEPATVRRVARLDEMVARRLAGEPLQYVLGAWGFRSLDLMVDPRVLIPRPETETVVTHALAELDRLPARPDRPRTVVDLGTGSGAIALSVAFERPDVRVWAGDVSPAALDVAGANLAGLGRAARRVRLVEGSWFEALPDELRGAVDLIVANPPYVATTDELPPEVGQWEPALALRSGPTGRDALEHLVAGAPAWLTRPGALVLELDPSQGPMVSAAAVTAGFTDVRLAPDLTGRDRALIARID
jgi:release factor glutamine methyltransferase